MTEVGEAEEDPARVVHRRGGTPRTLVALAVVFAALAIAGGAVAIRAERQRDDAAAVTEIRQDLSLTASRIVEALYNIDYRDFDRTRERVLDLAVGKLEREFEGSAGRLEQLATEGRTVVEVTVDEVFVGDVGADTATAVVRFDQVFHTVRGDSTTPDSFVLVILTRTANGWRVDDVQTLNAALPTGLGGGGGTTTTTSP